ncbi:lysophospholipase L1-like esterase [Rivularia sp. PCC 7116]|uniref:SGNH/GDSL hydrolase family protein n=1 Tax=Rivularia sp. PCC 7116 TaxID=373994 RepID=UPI00029EC75F|nr:SGNH/GDSL hydrolase family protein [Rivularia sp. PCC 7116]AFY58168.1 lysophospholipase L1-like esterase [Rivularia sp. PCC 7116]
MRKFYLVAASLLIGLTLPKSAFTQLSAINPEHYQLLLNRKNGWQKTKLEDTASASDSVSQNFSPPAQSSYNPPAPIRRRLISGSQLYHERLAALKAGYIYTRLAKEKLQSLLITRRKPKLTYQDWKRLLALEARAMTKGQGNNRLSIMLGDSLSLWFPTNGLPSGKLWLNQGISGDTSTGILRRISAFSSTKPEVIYIMAGINDLRKGTSDKVILSNHRRIVRRLKITHPNSYIVIQSILPTRRPKISNNRIRNLNTQLARIAKEEKVNYVNIHKWFADFKGDLRQDLTTDGLHLSLNGYEVWQAAIEQIEKKLALSKAVGTWR